MKRLTKVTWLSGVLGVLLAAGPSLIAQQQGAQGAQGGPGGQGGGRQRGNFDPAQMQQRMMDNIKEQFKITDDAEWKVIGERVQKVMDARRDVGFGGGMRGMFGRRGGGGNQGDQGGNRPRFGPEPSAEEQALEKAVESNASKEEMKTAMAKYRDARKAKEVKLQAAQDELKQVLSVPREAVALQMGLVR